ncbi:Dual specificity tyrosine-phosphorylation-regulated kinase 2 [Diplonema papillatum]|nr:Dual specificity tyrosine-phosphorylation-regulated kinase 2 [Diplonema papillatum]
MEIMNVPPKHVIEMSSRRKQFFDSSDNPRLQVNSRGKKRRPGMKDLASALRCNDAQFISFLEGFLRWDPRERFTADDGLRHEWIMDAMIPPVYRQAFTPMRTHSAETTASAKRAKRQATSTNQQQYQQQASSHAQQQQAPHHSHNHNHNHSHQPVNIHARDSQPNSSSSSSTHGQPQSQTTAASASNPHAHRESKEYPQKPAHETWGDVSSAKETQNHATTGGGGSAGGKYECAPAAKDGASGASGIGGHLGSLAEGFQQGKEGKEVDSTGAVQASHRQAIAQQGNSSANGPYQPTGGGNGTAAAQGENGPSLSSNTAPEHVNNQQTPAQAAQVHTPAHSAQHQQHQQQQPQQAQHGGAQAQTQAFGTIPRQLISSLPLGLSVLSQKPNTLLPPIDGIPTSLGVFLLEFLSQGPLRCCNKSPIDCKSM